MNTARSNHPEDPGRYEIRLRGRLDPRWSSRFDAMTMTTGDGFTLLSGEVVDQAALHGLLQQLRDIGLPLVSVTRVEPDAASHPTHHPDNSAGA